MIRLIWSLFQQEPVELMGMYGDSSVSSGMEAKSEQAKVLVKKNTTNKKNKGKDDNKMPVVYVTYLAFLCTYNDAEFNT